MERDLAFHRAHGFQGHREPSAEEIARQVDSIGGNMDAFTAKECVCFNIKVLDEHLPIALDMSERSGSSSRVSTPSDIERERGVIIEEIKMDEDNPDYLVHEIFTQNFWKNHALGKPILGTKETVKRFERHGASAYTQRFVPSNIIVSAAGHLNHEQFVKLVAGNFEQMKPVTTDSTSSVPKIIPQIMLRNKKSLEQVQICMGVPSHPIAHEKRHARTCSTPFWAEA